MKIDFTGRNINVTRALKGLVEERLSHTARVVPDVVDAHVTLAVDKHRHIVEIQVRRRRDSLTGTAWSRDMYRSIHKAVDRIEVQVKRKRERTLSRKRRGKLDEPDLPASVADSDADVERAIEVVEERVNRVKPITVDDAILLLESARRPFVMFRSAETSQFGVVYRRTDGRVGLIEPKG